jgi:Nif-specific regulatory protein
MDNNLKHTDISIDRLKEISTWVSSVQDLDQLLELIIETATRMMDAKASSLLLLDPKTQKLYFKVATGEKKDDVKQFEIDLGQGIAGHVAQTGESLLIPNVSEDPRWYKEISESIGFETRSIACVPMKVRGETIGVVEIIDKADGSAITDADLKILSVSYPFLLNLPRWGSAMRVKSNTIKKKSGTSKKNCILNTSWSVKVRRCERS